MLVVFEGIDACGKSTQIEMLREATISRFPGWTCQVFSYPNYQTATGQKILEMLKDPNRDPLLLQCTMTANRYEEQFLIEEALEDGALVILDRYWLSGLVYGAADGLSLSWLHRVHEQLLRPDHWFVLDIPVEESFSRRPQRDDDYENHHHRLHAARGCYRERCMAMANGHLIDGTASAEMIHAQILKVIGSGS